MKRIILALIFCMICITGLTQRVYMGSNISKEIIPDLDISFSPYIRFLEHTEPNQYSFKTGLGYDINRYFSLGASYLIKNDINKTDSSDTYGFYAFDTTTKYEWNKLRTQIRLRYSSGSDINNKDDDKSHYLRLKLGLQYTIEKLSLKPVIGWEIYRNMTEAEYDKSRYDAGLEYNFYRSHRIGTYYRKYHYFDDGDSIDIIVFIYKFKL